MNTLKTKQLLNHIGLGVVLLLFAVILGCSAPIGVTRLSPQDSYRNSIDNALASGTISDSTKAVLQRYNLLSALTDKPMKSLEALHDISKTDERRDLLYALSELSYMLGTKLFDGKSSAKVLQAQDLFLQSAVYAYYFLLDSEREVPPTAYDRRYRVACDLYNRSLWQSFPTNKDGSLLLRGNARQLTGKTLSLTITPANPAWLDDFFEGLFPSDSFRVRGFAVRNRGAGLGMPMVGVVRKSIESPNGGALPITALLKLPGNYSDYLHGDAPAILELFSVLDSDETSLNNQLVPLQTDITTPLAYRLDDVNLWTLGERRFITGAKIPLRVLLIQPYEPGRIPVVFVHGTASSPVWWAEMANSLRADPLIRKRFQLWFYQYNSSNMVLQSAAELRDAITEMQRQLDPDGQDQALHNMVVIGHSQGGLLAKTTVVDSGSKLWNSISESDLDSKALPKETKEFIQKLLFFKHLDSVKRVVFISTPHRGSYLTKSWVRSLISSIISIPSNILHQDEFLSTMGSHFSLPKSISGRIPTSIDGMSAENPLLHALADLPLADGVSGHSIIAVKPGMDVATGNDGVVEYKSAHIEGVESELVVRAEHSCQGHPFTIEEVRRILLEHIGINDVR